MLKGNLRHPERDDHKALEKLLLNMKKTGHEIPSWLAKKAAMITIPTA